MEVILQILSYVITIVLTALVTLILQSALEPAFPAFWYKLNKTVRHFWKWFGRSEFNVSVRSKLEKHPEQEYLELENVKEELKKLFKDKHLKTRVHELHFDENRNTHVKIQFSYESNIQVDESTGGTCETEEVKGILITVSSKPRYKDFDDEIKNMIAIVDEVETVLSNASFRLSKGLKDVCVELPRGVVSILGDLEAIRMSGTIKDSIIAFDCFEDKVVVNGIDATATGWLKGIVSYYG